MKGKLLPVAGAALVGVMSFPVGLGASAVPTSADARESAGPEQRVADPAGSCQRLVGRQLAGALVQTTEFVPAGSALAPIMTKNSPEFCRVSAHISPVAGSKIKIQLWLPSRWNGKFFGYGGGGFEGSYMIANIVLRRPVREGFAAVVTDAGHDLAPDQKWAIGQPEKVTDFGHRANHLGAVVAKAVVTDYYGTPATHGYFHGCSNGGRDALMLAQRYPEDYDAIAVGAPANSFTARMAAFSQMGADFSGAAGQTLVPKLKLLNEAAIASCDADDGVKDGLIGRPNRCRFDPAELLCKSGATEACLSKPEVALARSLYRGTFGRDGKLIMSGFAAGSELGWAPPPAAENMGTAFYRYLMYENPAWLPDSFLLDRDFAAGRKKLGPVLDATDPDLRPFLRRGGKLLMYHGWDDTAIPPGNSLRYYDQVVKTVGKKYAGNVRLFMLPGVSHCGQGKGPDEVNYVAALDRWTQSGVAPERLIAAKHDNRIAFFSEMPTKVLQSRPACAWPKAARYKGAGSPDDAASFECG